MGDGMPGGLRFLKGGNLHKPFHSCSFHWAVFIRPGMPDPDDPSEGSRLSVVECDFTPWDGDFDHIDPPRDRRVTGM